MKKIKPLLHFWIALASSLSFVGGWIIFAHTNKPASVYSGLSGTSAQSTTALAPIPSLDSLVKNATGGQTSLQPLPSIQLSSSTTVLRTRGS